MKLKIHSFICVYIPHYQGAQHCTHREGEEEGEAIVWENKIVLLILMLILLEVLLLMMHSSSLSFVVVCIALPLYLFFVYFWDIWTNKLILLIIIIWLRCKQKKRWNIALKVCVCIYCSSERSTFTAQRFAARRGWQRWWPSIQGMP